MELEPRVTTCKTLPFPFCFGEVGGGGVAILLKPKWRRPRRVVFTYEEDDFRNLELFEAKVLDFLAATGLGQRPIGSFCYGTARISKFSLNLAWRPVSTEKQQQLT